MNKNLSDYAKALAALSSEDIYTGLVGYGLFPEKLPPIFTSEKFGEDFREVDNKSFTKGGCGYVVYESIRNTNVPRVMGIPNPFAYYNLVCCIRDNWDKIVAHFKAKTEGDSHKVSKIHLRKIKGKKCIFEMNYKNHRTDDYPELDLRIGAKYLVKADISNCFPSMYSHALPWALVGKKDSKENKEEEEWYNRLDIRSRNMKNSETNGFLIGPHVSNLLSEIILVAVDESLRKNDDGKLKYFRNIDDYSFYAKSRDEAEQFLVWLRGALREYGLSLNHKKTEIIELPLMRPESWVNEINDFLAFCPPKRFEKGRLQAFVNKVVQLFKNNGENSAIINYAMKAIRERSADFCGREYYIKTIFHLSHLYPYIFPLLDKNLFEPFDVEVGDICKLSNEMYELAMKMRNYEAASYSIYYALKYGFRLSGVNSEQVKGSGDCVLLILAWRYSVRFQSKCEQKEYTKLAKELLKDDFDRYWIFVYEVLDCSGLKEIKSEENKFKDRWVGLKKKRISFLLSDEEIRAKVSPNSKTMHINLEGRDYGDERAIALSKEIWRQAGKDLVGFDAEEGERCLRLLLRNLFLGFVSNSNISISRERFKNSKFLSLLDWMRDNNYVGERLGRKPDAGEKGRLSCYWAKEKLHEHFHLFGKDVAPLEGQDDYFVELRMTDKRICEVRVRSEKEQRYQKGLSDLNEFYKRFEFTYRSPQLKEQIRFYPVLKAIFNRASWDCGGRLYSTGGNGISYQSLPSDIRRSIRIGGKKTVELDFSGMHIAMLYAKERVNVPEQIYDFMGTELVPLVKHLMLVLINSKTEEVALNEVRFKEKELDQYLGEVDDKDSSLLLAIKMMRRGQKTFEELVASIRKHHAPIEKYFGSDYGVRLQNRDSIIALEILEEFEKQGIPVLPVHDSFIIQKKHEGNLKEAMGRLFKKHNNGYPCEIH